MFSQRDIDLIKSNQLTIKDVKEQLALFKKGFPVLDFQGPAIPGKGIIELDEKTQQHFLDSYSESERQASLFIPASGAASRMFKSLYAYKEGDSSIADKEIVTKIMSLPLAPLLKDIVEKKGIVLNENSGVEAVRIMLDSDGLGLGNLPKALIPFHNYSGELRSALEEQIREASKYLSGQTLNFHITVSPEHIEAFEKELDKIRTLTEFRNKNINVKFSFQEKSTNTIAASPDGSPFRKDDGSLFFRPGGHGSLLLNLNQWEAPFFFIKNIDNITAGNHQNIVIKWKKILGGYLIELLEQIHSLLGNMEADDFLKKGEVLAGKILSGLPQTYLDLCDYNKKNWLFRFFNRPVRVCGMVKSDTATGGGPFLIRKKDGSISLQIVEEVQIPEQDREKYTLESTHFNPVDLACWVEDYKGNRFDLMKYRDPDTGFISRKSYRGKDLLALEWPGLWNGAMADWLTIFVEVPGETFNPVKTVFDLIAEVHQP